MNFIKKNYEKVLLGAVLLGLVGSLLFLPVLIANDKASEAAMIVSIVKRPPKPLPALDLSPEDAILNRVQSPVDWDFERTNRLFNPMQWKKRPDGGWLKIVNANVLGPDAVVVTKITPLYFILRLDRFDPATQFSPARYVISVEQQGALIPAERHARQHYLSVKEKDEVLQLVSVNGPANNPQLTLQILESGQNVNLSQSKPFQQVDGYAADLKYPPEGRKWDDVREGSPLKFNGNGYKVVVIDQNEVVISADSNQKKTTLPYQP